MKSSNGIGASTAFYVSQSTDQPAAEGFLATAATGSPWGSGSQHGGPPAALLTRAIERLHTGNERVIGRFTMELLGPVPVGPLSVTAAVVRPGRSVELCEATLYDEQRGRVVATAAGWRFPVRGDGPRQAEETLTHTHLDGEHHEFPASWSPGYLNSVDWRWIKGSVAEPGPGLVWMRPSVPLVETEQMSPMQRLMSCVDSASGVSAQLDITEWGFLNTELTVHVLRPPLGEWLCLDAQTTLGNGSVGMATSSVYDEHGLVARSAQALLISKR